MRQQDLVKNLQTLKELQPERGFVFNSKQLIYESCQDRPFSLSDFFKPAMVGSFAVLTLVIFGSYLIGARSLKHSAYTSLNNERLNAELDRLTIMIELEEISYQQTVNKTVASALQEIGNDRVRHLNKNLLNAERDNLNLDKDSGEEIESLLDSVIF